MLLCFVDRDGLILEAILGTLTDPSVALNRKLPVTIIECRLS